MAIRSLKNNTFSRSGMAGNPVIMPGSYESIATVTVGAGGASSVTFTGIPSTYTHLQLRMFCQFNDTTAGLGGASLQFNSDTGTNYTRHELIGEGTAASSIGFGTGTYNGATVGRFYFTPSSSIFSPAIVDILDYTNTNKNTTVRSLGGTDVNGSGGELRFSSSVWTNTAAVTSITIPASTTNFKQYSSIALYGVN
jgi:hypothetical protein